MEHRGDGEDDSCCCCRSKLKVDCCYLRIERKIEGGGEGVDDERFAMFQLLILLFFCWVIFFIRLCYMLSLFLQILSNFCYVNSSLFRLRVDPLDFCYAFIFC